MWSLLRNILCRKQLQLISCIFFFFPFLSLSLPHIPAQLSSFHFSFLQMMIQAEITFSHFQQFENQTKQSETRKCQFNYISRGKHKEEKKYQTHNTCTNTQRILWYRCNHTRVDKNIVSYTPKRHILPKLTRGKNCIVIVT